MGVPGFRSGFMGTAGGRESVEVEADCVSSYRYSTCR